jgi:hypothetical protein
MRVPTDMLTSLHLESNDITLTGLKWYGRIALSTSGLDNRTIFV